ncbi:hypothetical protein BH10BAC5_BH10BAC5_28500 [soil metagenome]
MTKYFLLLLFVFCSSSYLSAQIKTTTPDLNNLPSGIKYEGNIKNAVQWTDDIGNNIVITSETGETVSKGTPDNSYRDAALYGYHFIVVSGNAKQTWKVYDFIKACPVDIEAKFIKNTLQVTDLNNDGIGEIWLMYKTVCHGDVSPCDMKIIMYEGSQKFAMRGRNMVKVSDKDFEGGEYKFDKPFNEGPSEFREFAQSLWKQNILQTWGDDQ